MAKKNVDFINNFTVAVKNDALDSFLKRFHTLTIDEVMAILRQYNGRKHSR